MTPLPTSPPFVTFYTPTYKRPTLLAACLESVGRQTAAEDIEHLVIPDHVGYGLVEGLFGRLPWYAHACRGQYVHILCDDDTLPNPEAVATVRDFAEATGYPEVITVRVQKGLMHLPTRPDEPPQCGHVDLASYILRRDIWVRHCHDYGRRHEGDFDHAKVLHEAGYRHEFCDLLFVVGGQNAGLPEPEASACMPT